MNELLAICCFAWTAATGPVDGYFIHRGEDVVAYTTEPTKCIEVEYTDEVTVVAYSIAQRDVGPPSEPWTGQHWGRCTEGNTL